MKRNYLSYCNRVHCRKALLMGAVVFAVGERLPAQDVAQLHLIPQPREIRSEGSAVIRSTVIITPGGDTDDLFAASSLSEALKGDAVTVAPSSGQPDLTITLLRADSPESEREMRLRKIAFEPEMNAEGYVLISTPGRVAIVGKTSAGVFYGVQTLKQLIQRKKDDVRLWQGVIRDWPAMKYRGADDDLSRGPFPTLAFQEHQIDVFASYKVNLYSPYFEHTLSYSSDPLGAPPGGSLSRAEARELVAYAAKRHIVIVPEQEAFGHLHHRLKYEKYADMAESPHGNVLAPHQMGSLPLIKSWFTQIAEDFPSPFLHVGADETFDLGTGRTKADVDKLGLGTVYADFLMQIHSTLAPLNKRLLFWGDVAWNDPAAVATLPKDMIAIPWVYWHEDNYDANLTAFKNAGIETWVAPGDANWSQVYPLGANALDNISGFVESGQRLGSTGELTTAWNDDGEGLFNEDWFGMLFSAAAGWQSGKSDSSAYEASFGTRFYGDTTGEVDEAEREIIAAQKLIDTSDDAFWIDPWSKEGIIKGSKLRAKIPEARLHAEKAIELILMARQSGNAMKESDALDAMELGARRIDFIGMKFQLAEEMEEDYAKAYAMRGDYKRKTETRELLYAVSAMNGRCQDLRDGYSMLKNLYRTSWLAENRPYWLDNVLVRYDLRIQLWEQRGEAISQAKENWDVTKDLPTAEKMGIPAPSQQ